MQFTLSCIGFLFISPSLALYPNLYGNPTGSVALYSDASCHTTLYSNNWTLGGDFCAVLPPETSSSSSVPPPGLGSYLIALRPTCDNGSYADWATYGDSGCSEEKTRVPNNNDDTCEPLTGVMAVAFICSGFAASGSATANSKSLLQTISTIAIATTSIDITSHSTISPTSTTEVGAGNTSTMSSSSVLPTGISTGATNTSATLSSPSAIHTAAACRMRTALGFAAQIILALSVLTGV